MHGNDTLILPTWCKILMKGLSNIDPAAGTCTLAYTYLVWINVSTAPEEVRTRLASEVRYRFNAGAEEKLEPANSNMRPPGKDGIITITHRAERTVPLAGDQTYAPFGFLDAQFNYEFSHFELVCTLSGGS
jgi:hypothetical protein